MDSFSLQAIKIFIRSKLTIHLSSGINGEAEPMLSGYSFKSLEENGWEVNTEKNITIATHNWVEWVFGEGVAFIYGHFIKNDRGEIVYREVYPDGPYKIIRNGDGIKVKPKVIFEEKI